MKQFLVIGLGNFGYYLATHLYQKGHEVMAIDKNPDLVQKIKNLVTQAMVADATDAAMISELGIKDIDAAVVGIGSVLGDSILAVMNLQEVGVRHIVAKAINDPHKRILEKLGVQEIAFPEKDNAVSMAERLDNPNLMDYLPFLEGYQIIELAVPARFVGKTLRQLDLTNRFGVQILAIKTRTPKQVRFIPGAEFTLGQDDLLILLGTDQGLEKLKKH